MSLERSPVKVIIGASPQPARKGSETSNEDCRGVTSRHRPEGGVTGKFISAGKSKSSGCHHAIYAKTKGIDQLRIKRVRFSKSNELSARIVSCALIVEFIR